MVVIPDTYTDTPAPPHTDLTAKTEVPSRQEEPSHDVGLRGGSEHEAVCVAVQELVTG